MENQTTTEASLEQLKRLQVFLSYDPENERLWLDTAQLSLSLKEWQVAEALVQGLSEPLKVKSTVTSIAGQILLTLKQYPEALDYLLQAASDGSSHPSVWINLAYCYFYQERFAEAVDALNQNTATKTALPEDHALLSAKLAYHLDDSERAIAYLLELHNLHAPSAESAGFLSLLLFEDDQLEQAMQLANLALAKNPHSLEALIARSSLYLSDGANDLALTDIQVAVNYYPHAGRAWSTLAQIEFGNMQFESAKIAAEKAVQYMPDHIGTWHVLGWSHLMLGTYDRALWAFEMSYELDKSFGETHGGLAYTYTLLGQTEQAKEHIKRAERLDKDSFASTFAQIGMMVVNNDIESAREFLEQWKMSSHSKLQATPQELINKRMTELMREKTVRKTVH